MYGINKLRTIQKFSMTTGTRKLQLMGVIPGRVWRGKTLTSTKSTTQHQEGLVARWVAAQACVLLGVGEEGFGRSDGKKSSFGMRMPRNRARGLTEAVACELSGVRFSKWACNHARPGGKVVDLRFRCPEDVQNTLIHHTKMKFLENVAAKLTHANVSRMSIIGTQKKCWKIGWSRESAEVCDEVKFSRCPWWRQT